MSEKKYDARLNQVKGNFREGLGKVTGNKKLGAKGPAEKIIIKGKGLASDVREGAKGATKNVKKALHKDN